MSEEQKTDETQDEQTTESKFEQLVRGLSDTQFAAAKATVAAIDGERNPPNVSSMSDNEFEAYKRNLTRGK